MPEHVRNLVGRIRAALADRRRAPRRPVRLPCTVTVTVGDSRAPSAPQRAAPSLEGVTRDASASGLALALPSVRVGGRYLTDGELAVRLELPDGELELRVQPVSYERLPPDDPETGYLIGARITVIDDAARARFESLLRQ